MEGFTWYYRVVVGLLFFLLIFLVAGMAVQFFQKKEQKDEVKKIKNTEMLDAYDKQYSRDHITELVTISNSDYRVKPMGLGGMSGVEVSVQNHSKYMMDLVLVEVQYIRQNGNLYRTEKLTFQNLKPNQIQQQYAPDSKRGTQLKCAVRLVKSTELGL